MLSTTRNHVGKSSCQRTDRLSAWPTGRSLPHLSEIGANFVRRPIAHLGYYHREFVQRRRWLVEARYAKLLAPRSLCPHHESAVMNSCSRSSLRLELGRNCPSAEPQAAAQAVKAANGEFWWNGAWYLNQPINKDSSGGPCVTVVAASIAL